MFPFPFSSLSHGWLHAFDRFIPWWLGVLAAVVLLALLFFLGHKGRIAHRRFRRRRAGLCMECGYDLRTQLQQSAPRCPECGKPIMHFLYKGRY
jgi:hypothetical protein